MQYREKISVAQNPRHINKRNQTFFYGKIYVNNNLKVTSLCQKEQKSNSKR